MKNQPKDLEELRTEIIVICSCGLRTTHKPLLGATRPKEVTLKCPDEYCEEKREVSLQ